MPRFPPSMLSALLMLVSPPSLAAGSADPFDTEALHQANASGSFHLACGAKLGSSPQSLAEVVDYALCNNPQTRLAWAYARAQAAQVGLARSATLPELDASVERSRTASSPGSSYSQSTASLSASLLIYDFGARAATQESARQMMAALNASQDASLQTAFFAAVQAYYQWHALDASVAAARMAETASEASFKAAQARYRIGTGTPADALQAQTAASQARLALIQAEGSARSALGTLANAMGLDAQQAPALAPPPDKEPESGFESRVDALITAAQQRRPDLVAARAQLHAAQAERDVARASAMPSLSLAAGTSFIDHSQSGERRGNSLALSLSIPLFTGFATTYRVRGAEAQIEAKTALREQLAQQVSLDVWRSYHALTTSIAAVRASADLLASSAASEKVAMGRYRAGVGNIIELLNAQSALASARQQRILALYNWRIAKAALALAMRQLDFAQIDGEGGQR
ncbi:TolC family protein [Niveibacterium terrae]|uniref:TolC family protein n=1 Tax=Niveibacterium terrae TaxID=3373598 RepID=UPI003A951FF3